MDFYSMAVLQCYNNRLQELDWSGEAQKYSFIFRIMATGQCEVLEDDCTDDEIWHCVLRMMAEYIKEKESWTAMLMAMAMKAVQAIVNWFM